MSAENPNWSPRDLKKAKIQLFGELVTGMTAGVGAVVGEFANPDSWKPAALAMIGLIFLNKVVHTGNKIEKIRMEE